MSLNDKETQMIDQQFHRQAGTHLTESQQGLVAHSQTSRQIYSPAVTSLLGLLSGPNKTLSSTTS